MAWKGIFTVILLLLILCSCGPVKSTSPTQPTSAAEKTVYPTNSPTRTDIATQLPTWTPIPTQTQTDTRPPTLTLPPTLTPFPTYSTFYQNVHAFEMLYDTNAGCELPCWWGITPGVTTWEETLQFINRFRDFNSVEKSRAVDDLYFWNSYAPHIDYAPSVEFIISNGVVSTIRVPSDMVKFQFLLHGMLQKFGIPSHIYIGRNPRQVNDPEHTNINAYVLFEEHRTMVIMAHLYGATENNQIRGGNNLLTPCELWYSEELFLWSPDSNSFLDILRESDVKLLEQVSPMTVEGFYEKFRHPLGYNKKCIELKDNYWRFNN